MKSLAQGIKNVLLWSYERGSWQYDLLCLLIIATIFLVPGKYFGDRDRIGATKPETAADRTGLMQEIKAEDVHAFLARKNQPTLMKFPPEALGFYLQEQYNRPVRLLRYEEFTDSQGKIRYRVWFE